MMMAALTPAEVLERRRRLVLGQDTEGFVDLFAADGVIELPCAGRGTPARFTGQQEIRDFASHTAASAFSALQIDDLETAARTLEELLGY
jgi:uncharacterized protein